MKNNEVIEQLHDREIKRIKGNPEKSAQAVDLLGKYFRQ
jgi:hypothetical protein